MNNIVSTLTLAQTGGVVIDDGTAQRSMVRTVTLTFQGDVNVTPSLFALTVNNKDNNGTLSSGSMGNANNINLFVSSTLVNGNTVVTLTFGGKAVVGGSLPDGRYSLAFGSTTLVSIYRLFGDVTGDQRVTNADRNVFNATNGARRGVGSAYNSIFDFDGNGYVNGTDLAYFLANFNKSINAAGIVG